MDFCFCINENVKILEVENRYHKRTFHELLHIALHSNSIYNKSDINNLSLLYFFLYLQNSLFSFESIYLIIYK